MALQVHDIVHAFAKAAEADDPMSAARSVIDEMAKDIDAVASALDYLPGTGGNALQSFYRAPNLSLLKVSFPQGRRTPPHNHGTWATILVLSGSEKNTLYLREPDGSLRRSGEKILGPGDVLPMRAEAVHVAECMGDEPAIGLHVYGANVLGTTRHMWDPDTLKEQPLDWGLYEGLAKRASAADSAPAGV
jgi:predicted metal-dependent enzyme (double-stranded beta helix superfamily)